VFDPDIEWLRVISPELVIAVAVLEEQHVRRAAERLGVPQPTVSAVMHRLAHAIGAPLVAPRGRGIIATDAGRAFLPAAQQALVNLRAAGQDLQEVIDPDRGRIALGFMHSRGPRDVPRLLDAFLAAYPDISFTLKQGGAPAVLDQLRAGCRRPTIAWNRWSWPKNSCASPSPPTTVSPTAHQLTCARPRAKRSLD
jgi:DNA-binding transcriptional LysR family regulator